MNVGGGSLEPTGGSGGTTPIVEDPKTCAEAAAAKSYVGCDFWPTVVDNIVFSYFDFAVVVANAGESVADITVERLGSTIATATVAPSTLFTIYLPWVDELKSPSNPSFCAPSSVKTETVRAVDGAYHLTSTVPVTVYQFNAIEYAGTGGPPGKDWSACDQACGIWGGCFSYTNDASILLPSTAWTGTYRIGGAPSWTDDEGDFTYPPYFAVTAIEDGTHVDVKLSVTGAIAGGGGVPSAPLGGSVSFSLDQGDVVQLVGAGNVDLSGALVSASAAVQVITGIACSNNPHGVEACDHLEESVLPAETLGKHYFVTVPTGPQGQPVGHVVRLYGNVDSTSLTYSGAFSGPSTLSAGEVVDLGVVNSDFEVSGDHEFTVASFQVGADLLMPGVPVAQQKGDPAQSYMVAVEQYRKKYVFLAPTDYDVSYVDIVQPVGATVSLDGTPISTTVTPLSSGYGAARVLLDSSTGAHVLTGSEPFGIQVMGYGTYTSYQYPGGLNLGHIAPAPPK